jgi:NAD(P)-dependent dehydrogenase (short-subunit alcohol dehydrogenase family)
MCDQSVAVSGGSRGIGFGIAERFVRAGANVMLLARTTGELRTAKERLIAIGNRSQAIDYLVMDGSDTASIASAFGKLCSWTSRLNVFVANAGVHTVGPFVDLTLADWQKSVELNLTGTFLACQAAARRMLAEPAEDNHAILVVSSIRSFTAVPGGAAYAATKAGVNQLVRVAAAELAPRRIRVNAIAPGITATETAVAKAPEVFAGIASHVPLGRAGDPSDCGEAALFLCSEAGQFITGAVLPVDGGGSLR